MQKYKITDTKIMFNFIYKPQNYSCINFKLQTHIMIIKKTEMNKIKSTTG